MESSPLDAAYFQQLNRSLRNHERAIPVLLLDLDLLDQNIERLRALLRPQTDFRIVVKSLPSRPLVEYVAEKLDTRKLMVFHQPFLSELSAKLDERWDILLGKPMPAKTAEYYYRTLETPGGFGPATQLQWLADTRARIDQYLALAQATKQKIRLNLEIDVGLRRGGFDNLADLSAALELIGKNSEWVDFSGFMGYDPHVVKLPKFLMPPAKAMAAATKFYRDCVKLLQDRFPELYRPGLTFNGAGSPTIALHHGHPTPLNDLSAGSCLVMPTDFDISSLEGFKPACFIAAPILKKFPSTRLPGLKAGSWLQRIIAGPNRPSAFIYGGYWKANYCYPAGTTINKLYGQSTNQCMVNLPAGDQSNVDDFVFLRPRQSEFVFLHFSEILLCRNRQIIGEWPVL